MPEEQWLYTIDGEQIGPVSETQIDNLPEDVQVDEDAILSTEEMTDGITESEIITPETYQKILPQPTPEIPKVSPVSQIRPLVRFAAKLIDINVFIMFVGFSVGLFQGRTLNAFHIMLALFIWNFSEAYLISTCSTTFGKWLCGIYVYDSDGSRLTYLKALRRSFLVYVSSCGLYLPIISLATMGSEYFTLRKKGKTYADNKGDYIVQHRRVSIAKIVIIFLLMISFVFFIGAEIGVYGNIFHYKDKQDTLEQYSSNTQALTGFDRNHKKQPKDAKAWEDEARNYFDLKHYDEAIACCDKALAIYPQYECVWRIKSASLGMLGRWAEANDCCNKILEINPQDEHALFFKGAYLRSLGRHNIAIFFFDMVLKINPKHASAWSQKGLSLKCLGRITEALACYDKALEINPTDITTRRRKEAVVNQ